MKCLLIGGAGFIGSHIVDALVERGHEVRIFDLPNVSTENLTKSIESVELIKGNFQNENDISAALTDMDVVVHLVCSTVPGPSNENPIYDVETNVVGTLNLLKKSVEKNIKKIIFASSGGTVYGLPQVLPISELHPTNPICSYGITKLTIENYLALYKHLYGLDYTVLRIGNPYGERQRINNIQGAVAVFLGKALTGDTITIWGNGSVARDYFYVGDLVSAFVKVIESEVPSSVYNIAGGRSYSLNDVLSIIGQVSGQVLKVRFSPARDLDVSDNCLDIKRARDELEWHPEISLGEGVEKFCSWLKSEGNLFLDKSQPVRLEGERLMNTKAKFNSVENVPVFSDIQNSSAHEAKENPSSLRQYDETPDRVPINPEPE